MKIANSYENCRRPRRNYTPKRENCKLIWKLQTGMKIANWYENCKAILTFRCIVPTLMFAIFIWDTAGMKTCSGTERMFRFDCGVDDTNTMKQSLAKPSTIHILIPIPMLTHSDSYILRHDSSALISQDANSSLLSGASAKFVAVRTVI